MNTSLAILISGGGTNVQALIDAQARRELGAQVALVISDRAEAYGLQRALQHGIAAAFVPLSCAAQQQRAAARAIWEDRLLALLAAYTPGLIILSGFMRVLSASFLDRCGAPVINQHPALLPDEGGESFTTSDGLIIPALRGAHVVRDALHAGLTITGCSIHRVTPRVDDGPVLARAEVPILSNDDEASLHERIKAEERRLLTALIQQWAAGTHHGTLLAK
ncbi:MAG: phosphoribosylglycinamide formyltransferase [Roseiflexaceae bacterium]|nr:phosphoribosylglycinamide formyltransferase [Roseiflexaceae bacterium]